MASNLRIDITGSATPALPLPLELVIKVLKYCKEYEWPNNDDREDKENGDHENDGGHNQDEYTTRTTRITMSTTISDKDFADEEYRQAQDLIMTVQWMAASKSATIDICNIRQYSSCMQTIRTSFYSHLRYAHRRPSFPIHRVWHAESTRDICGGCAVSLDQYTDFWIC